LRVDTQAPTLRPRDMRTCSSGITEATTTSAPARVSVSVMHDVSISSLSSATGTSTVRRLACACMHRLDHLVFMLMLSAGTAARATRPRASVVWVRSSAVRPSIFRVRAEQVFDLGGDPADVVNLYDAKSRPRDASTPHS
jgi:hypothetical protein